MQGKAVYTSTDGGDTWTLRGDVPLFEGTPRGSVPICGHLTDQWQLCAVSARRAFMSLWRTTLFVTNDSGTDWRESISVDETEGPSFMKFISEHEGWVSTIEQGLLHTQDGGVTWQTLWTPPSNASHS